jgi:hypothetical protein
MKSVATRGEVVTILIGPKKKRYIIHKDIICHHSEYFRTAYNGRWKESDEGVSLEDVEVEVFNVFVHWLYTQQLPEDKDFRDIANINNKGQIDNEDHECDTVLLKAFVFGNRFLVADFERITHNHLADWLTDYIFGVPYELVILAYEVLPSDSRILGAMAEMQCLNWSPREDGNEKKQIRVNLPKDFLIQVMIRQSELRDKISRMYRHVERTDFYMQEKIEGLGK